MKLQLLDVNGVPFSLHGADSIKAIVPYHKGKLEKGVDILDAESGMIGLSLSEFEVDGLKEGPNQTFWVVAEINQKRFTFRFPNMLNVSEHQGKKVIE